MASIKRIGRDKSGVPIWEAVYRRTPGGKQIRRRFHAENKSGVEREILLDSNKSDVDLKWSEGIKIYVEAKHSENRNPEAIAHAERAVSVFIQTIGDISIESTKAADLKHFLHLVASGVSVRDINGNPYTTHGASVANHHRKELLTVARYLLRYSGKITVIPFENVPSLPLKIKRRSPIPEPQVQAYLDALQPYVLRPVQMVLFYGLRSTAICNLTPDAVRGDFLTAVDKGNIERRIPVDAMLAEIIREALAYRAEFASPSDRLFVNKTGNAWNRTSLLRSAQRYWEAAGLEKKKIHEVRHTLGTVAGKHFSPSMVQAAMGHQSRQSSETYFHPNEWMAAEVRQKIVTELSQKPGRIAEKTRQEEMIVVIKDGRLVCPCCGANLLLPKEKGHKP